MESGPEERRRKRMQGGLEVRGEVEEEGGKKTGGRRG